MALREGSGPFISVIVTAFNRRQFLPSALKSIANQSLEKANYEVIVVKNFLDKEIDSELRRLGARSRVKGNENIGAYLLSGIESSTGEVLVFLDDDDEFEGNRLQVIYDLFKNDAGISYFHNDLAIIDAQGNPLEERKNFRSIPSETMQRYGSFLVNSPLSQIDAGRLLWVGAADNMSSIAIRRTTLLPFLEHLSAVDYSPDFFMFCATVAAKRYQLAICSNKLTRYRLHQANISTSSSYESRRFPDLLDAYKKRLTRETRFSELLLQMADDARPTDVVKRMILNYYWETKMSYDITTRAAKETVMRDALGNLSYALPGLSYPPGIRERWKIFLHSFRYLLLSKQEWSYFLAEKSRSW